MWGAISAACVDSVLRRVILFGKLNPLPWVPEDLMSCDRSVLSRSSISLVEELVGQLCLGRPIVLVRICKTNPPETRKALKYQGRDPGMFEFRYFRTTTPNSGIHWLIYSH